MTDLKTDNPNLQAHLQEAALWCTELQDEQVSQAQIARWLDWLDAHPENLAAFESIQQLTLRLAAKRRPARRVPLRRVAIAAGVATLLWGGFICIKITGVFAPQSSLLLF